MKVLSRKETGRIAEEKAKEHLVKLGYEILHVNWHFGHLELDIVAKDNNQLVVVEVKSRTGIRYEHPSEAVTDQKIRCIVEAAEAYIYAYDVKEDTRFDVITVIFLEGNIELEHFVDAFYPML